MSTPTLDDTDRAILEGLAAGRSAADLADEFETAEVDDRLAALAESGLVVPEDEYELTDSGRRVLEAPGDTSADDRVDVPDHVEETLERADLPPDRAAAIRSAFAFLAYWGEATAHEIRDAVYSERPAGYESSAAWWDDFTREHLADLPDIDPGSADASWRYAGEASVDDPTMDGRRGPGDPEEAPSANAKHALESLELDADERDAVHAAFALLADRGEATRKAIADAVYDDHPAGYDSAEDWWDRVSDALEEFPGVTNDGETWQYDDRVEGGRVGGDAHVSATTEPMDADEAGAGGDRLPGSDETDGE